jgi:hypothetical protein
MIMAAKVVSILAARQVRETEMEDSGYKALILSMDKLELLEEMVRFQEERSRKGQLTLSMMIRGKILFRALEDNAETHELRMLTRSYRRHLEHEIASYLEDPTAPRGTDEDGLSD